MRKLYGPPAMAEEKRSISGGYTPLEQTIFQYGNRQLLLIQGTACVDGSCCGYSNWNYIQVIGYLLKPWKIGENDSAATLEIDTIENLEEQKAIRELLVVKFPNSRIEFN